MIKRDRRVINKASAATYAKFVDEYYWKDCFEDGKPWSWNVLKERYNNDKPNSNKP